MNNKNNYCYLFKSENNKSAKDSYLFLSFLHPPPPHKKKKKNKKKKKKKTKKQRGGGKLGSVPSEQFFL